MIRLVLLLVLLLPNVVDAGVVVIPKSKAKAKAVAKKTVKPKATKPKVLPARPKLTNKEVKCDVTATHKGYCWCPPKDPPPPPVDPPGEPCAVPEPNSLAIWALASMLIIGATRHADRE